MEGSGGCCLLPSRWRTDWWKGEGNAACFPSLWRTEGLKGGGDAACFPSRWRTDRWKGAGDAACSMAGGGQMGGRERGMLPALWQVEDRWVDGRWGCCLLYGRWRTDGWKGTGDAACFPSRWRTEGWKGAEDAACSLAGGGQRGGRERRMLPAP